MNTTSTVDVHGQTSSVFQNRNFMLLFSGRLVSQIGDQVYLFALAWWVLRQTGSPAFMGILMMASMLPHIVLGPFSGVFVDRINRKYILVGMDIARGITILIMYTFLAAGHLTMTDIYTGAVIMSICDSFYSPACAATIPNLVGDHRLNQANSLDSMAVNGSQVLGPIIAGALYVTLGIQAIFLINAFSYIFSAVSQLFIRINGNWKLAGRKRTLSQFNVELKEGFQYLRSRRGLFRLFCYLIIMNFLLAPILQVYLPYIFNMILHSTAQRLSFVQGCFGVGMVIGAGIAGRIRPRKFYHKHIWVSFLFFQVLIGGFVLPLLPGLRGDFSVSQVVLLYCILAIPSGIFLGLGDIPVSVVYQRNIPDEVRGRVNAIFFNFGRSAMPLGFLVGGFFAEHMQLYVLATITVIVMVLNTILYGQSKIAQAEV